MNISFAESFDNTPKARKVADLLSRLEEPGLSLLKSAQEIHVETIITHGKQAMAVCQVFVSSWKEFSVLFDFTSAGCKTIHSIRLYQRI